MGFMIFALVAVVVVTMLLYMPYMSLIQKKNKVREAVSSIDVQLKRRYDLIPNILTIAKKFMEHEKGLIEEVTKLRTQAIQNASNINNFESQIKTDKQITDIMSKLLVSVENYPQLKSDATMVNAMENYREIEDHIAAARRFYNAAVLELNNAVEIFPSSVYATLMNIKQNPFIEATETERKTINASDYLN